MSKDNFANEHPIAISEEYKEKLGISEEELRGEELSEVEDSEEEEEEFEGASLEELRESEEFREAWRKKHQKKQEELQESADPEEKLRMADRMEKRGGGWSSEAERIREEVEPSEAEKIGREVAKRLNPTEELSEAQAEELAEAESEESEIAEPEEDYIRLDNGDSTVLFTEHSALKEELRNVSKWDDVTIISEGDIMEARIHDREALLSKIQG